MVAHDLSVDELLTDAQLRELLGVSRTTLWRIRKHAGLPFGRIGRSYRYRKAEVLKWIAENSERSGPHTLNPESQN